MKLSRKSFFIIILSSLIVTFLSCKKPGEPPPRPGTQLLDVHGAGAQRSDPKTGNAGGAPGTWAVYFAFGEAEGYMTFEP